MDALRYYQHDAVLATYDFLQKRTDNPCIVCPTGAGKSHILAQICYDVVNRWSGRVLMVTHVKELVEQNAEKIKNMLSAQQVGIYSAGLNRRDTTHPIIGASIQSIYKRACEFDPFDLVLVDECFPTGTLVSTPRGEIAIENLYIGQPVHTALGVGEIEAISARNAGNLIELELENGKTIRCTPNHPFFTEQGWQNAGAVEVGTALFSKKDVQMLREYVSALDHEKTERNNSKLYEGIPLEKATLLFNLLLKEGGECDVAAGCSRKSQSNFKGNRAWPNNSRGERSFDRTTATFIEQTGRGLVSGICGGNRETTPQRNAQKYQDRHCQSRTQNCNRDRWKLSCHDKPAQGRQKTDGIFASQRVVRITPIQCKSPTAVFNLQIKGHPSYYANGVLAHNCHLIPPDSDGMYQQFLAEAKIINPKIRVVGLTATPYRMTSGLLCGPDNILNDICYEIGVKELIMQGYLGPLKSKAGKHKADTSALHIRDGEFINAEIADLMDNDSLVHSACNEIIAETKHRNSVLIFASSVGHAQHIKEKIQRTCGQEVGMVTGDTPSGKRTEIIKRFKGQTVKADLFGATKGPLKYLVNVNVLTTGFDAPNVDCVVLLRPTNSPGLYYQMVGRGFRLHPSKDNCLVLDFGGNILRHGPVDSIQIRERNGKGSKSENDAPAKECPECQALIHAGYSICPECGYEFPKAGQNHEATASTEGILSGEITDEEFAVTGVSFYEHIKRNADENTKPTLRVEYRLGLGHYESEWICFEHTGYARRKAENWWQARSNEPVPDTVWQALDLANAGALADTNAITVRSISGQKYNRIIAYDIGPKPSLLDGSEEKEDAFMPDYSWADDDIPF